MRLTPAERDVVAAVARGLRLAEIAEERGTSVKTVKAQAGSARGKAGARTLAQLAALWTLGEVQAGRVTVGRRRDAARRAPGARRDRGGAVTALCKHEIPAGCCEACRNPRMPSTRPGNAGPGTPWTDDDVRELLRLRGEGASDLEVCAALGRTIHSVWDKVQWLKGEPGYDVPSPKRVRAERRKAALQESPNAPG